MEHKKNYNMTSNFTNPLQNHKNLRQNFWRWGYSSNSVISRQSFQYPKFTYKMKNKKSPMKSIQYSLFIKQGRKTLYIGTIRKSFKEKLRMSEYFEWINKSWSLSNLKGNAPNSLIIKIIVVRNCCKRLISLLKFKCEPLF